MRRELRELRERLLRVLLEEVLLRDEEERADRVLDLEVREELAEVLPGRRLMVRSLPVAFLADTFWPGRRGGGWK